MHDIWLIRHAQSESNAGLPTSYPGSAPLTELGRRQAEKAARLFDRAPDRIVVSPFVRTRQTAEPLMVRFPECSLETWPVQEFTYLAPSKYAHTTMDQRAAEVAEYWARLDPVYRDGEGAETFVEFAGRVDDCLKRLRGLSGRTALFCHGQFLRGVMLRCLMHFIEDAADVMRRFRGFREGLAIPNAAVVRLRFAEEGASLGGVNVTHLDGLSSPPTRPVLPPVRF